MIVLRKDSTQAEVPTKVVLLFGLGLIGREIFNNLIAQGFSYTSQNFDWNDAVLQESDARSLIVTTQSIINAALSEHASTIDIAIVWAAGKAGFGSLEAEMIVEELSFRAVLNVYKLLANGYGSGDVSFHLMSSAGGLFESQSHVGAKSVAAPCRAYGHLKLRMETLLEETVKQQSRYVYRPSSVYGPLNTGRAGIIATLIKNGLLNKEVQILGSMNTLRDYVFSGDIGRFVSTKITSTCKNGAVYFLVSGRPTSILQLKTSVERILNKKIYICSSLSSSNSENITFDHSCLPPEWQPTELNLGISTIYSQFFSKITIS